jgi:malate synthase
MPATVTISGTSESYALEVEMLSPSALEYLRALHLEFEARRVSLLNARTLRQGRLDAGEMPAFLDSTRQLREASWTVAPIPPDLMDRRVEITGPPERKMIINALNSGAKVFMADFEDSNAPTWMNCLEGQRNLRDANERTITYTSPEGKNYSLIETPAVLFVRPRGWHMVEKHLQLGGSPVSASLFDFGMYLFHNAKLLMDRNTAPYFYLPKLESHLEARLWNDVFIFSQEYLGIPNGTIRATVLIETILAAFEMDEILFELRDHSAGLNCGRWDYIFSFIKKFRNRPDFILPERSSVTMTQPFLAAYVELLIDTCHRRGIHAMGGMAAQIPIRNNAEANREAMERVRQDKLREVRAGHDGTWVAHPGLVPIAREVFDEYMPGPHQILPPRGGEHKIRAEQLVEVPQGPLTEAGLEKNIDVALQYLESWLRGSGCVPIYNLMEDAATAEISRAQIWQWAHYGTQLAEGRTVTIEMVKQKIAAILKRIESERGAAAFSASSFTTAANLLIEISSGPFQDFLTTAAYRHLK